MIYRRYVDDRATDDLEQPPSLAHRGAWAVALLAAVALTATFLGDALSGDEEVTSATESRRADELRAQRFAADRGVDATEVVVSSESGTVDDPRFARGVDGLATELRAQVRLRSPPSTTPASSSSREIKMRRRCSSPSAAMPKTTSRVWSRRSSTL